MPAASSFPACHLSPSDPLPLLPALLNESPNGLVLCTPVYDAAGGLEDLALACLNPAAQNLLNLPARPAVTITQHFPNGRTNGIWECLRDAFLSVSPGWVSVPHTIADEGNRFQLACQRVAGGLLLSLTAVTWPAGASTEGRDLAEQRRQPGGLGFQDDSKPAAVDTALLPPADETPNAPPAGEATYRTLFERMDQGFCILQMLFDAHGRPADYRYLETNPAFVEQTGLPDARGKTVRELVPGIEPFWVDVYAQVARTGEPVRFVDHASSLQRWFEVYAFRIGEPLLQQVAVLFTDITKRKQVEHALRQSQQQQAFLLQLSDRLRPLSDAGDIQHQAACALGQYLGASRVGYAEDLGNNGDNVVTRTYTRDGVPGIEGRYHYDDYGPELLRALKQGQTVARPDVAHDSTLTPAEKAAHAALQLGATVDVPLLKDGQLVAVFFLHYPHAHNWSSDELALIEETAERTWDVVMRARTEAALRDSEERLRKALSIATVGVLYFDLEGVIHDTNAAFERMSGYARAELARGQAYLDALTAPEFISATHHALLELRTTGESTPFEKQYLRPDGSRWWGLSAGKRLSERECVKFVLDITEAKQAEAALRQSEQQLQHANEQLTRTNVDLDNFIYTASHDLKAPITNIEGLLQELERQLPADEQMRVEVEPLVGMMQDAVARFQRTITHLTDITKLQKEHDQLATEVLLRPVIEDVRQDLQPLLHATGARLDVDVAACPRVVFSAKNLRSVVYNLLSNALKYRHPDRPPHVHISCGPAPQGPYHMLRVQDNGLGIEASRHSELFTMFRRLHTHVEGSGVGLYMVKRMVENVGGRIEVRSQLGEGSTFCVYLPHAPGPAA